MNRDYIVRENEGRKVPDLLRQDIGEIEQKPKPKFLVPCAQCGVEVERAFKRTNAECFDCKMKRITEASLEYRKKRGY